MDLLSTHYAVVGAKRSNDYDELHRSPGYLALQAGTDLLKTLCECEPPRT